MASNVTIPISLIVVMLFASYHTEAYIGMNWGRQSAQRLLPSQVVDLMLQNGIGNARIFTSQEDILKAFTGSGINLTITVDDITFPRFGNADNWFRAKSSFFLNSNVRTVILGNKYMFTTNPNNSYIDGALRALRSVQLAFDQSGNRHIKATATTRLPTVLTPARRPSDCEFIDAVKDKMVEFLEFLKSNDAPFLADTFLIGEAARCNLPFSFALPRNTSSDLVIKDINGAVYTNVFEWQYDCLAWALHKLNASDVKIVISAIGWPTDGYDGANAKNAEHFFKYLLPLVSNNKGTPMRPRGPIDIYIHELTDEPKMMTMDTVERHWGVYRSNGQSKYKIDVSGQGRDIYPTMMKGIMRMPERWCLFNGNLTDVENVINQTEKACTKGDCTTLVEGASCGNLSFISNVSYAFNVYFQTFFQDEKACDFDGLGFVSEQDPSERGCLFPVEVVKGQQLIDLKYQAVAGGHGLQVDRIMLVFVFCILGAPIWS